MAKSNINWLPSIKKCELCEEEVFSVVTKTVPLKTGDKEMKICYHCNGMIKATERETLNDSLI